MMRRLKLGWIVFVMGLLVACGQEAPTAPPITPTAAPLFPTSALASEVVSQAEEIVAAMARGDFTAASSNFDATMKTALPADKLQASWNQLVASYGPFQQVISSKTEAVQDGATLYNVATVTCQFEKAAIDVWVAFDAQKQVAGLFFRPASAATPVATQGPAAYVNSAAFTEHEVTVGSGQWALPGTLSLPKAAAPVAAVVLVHGSGPQDRDETIGPNKPFRDLAGGLASRGIAVLRYDKRTYAHNAEFAQLQNSTVKEETVDDALLAVALLRGRAEIDKAKIFVLGHSLGGTLLPRIGAADQEIAGLISLAGSTIPLEDNIVAQFRYIYGLDGSISADEQSQLDALEEQRMRVKDASLAPNTPADQLFGIPASYWLDLHGYDPASAAAALRQALLFLQGERDYQVTMADFANWKSALATTAATFKSYPQLNHLFIPGEGRIEPSEYEKPGHVAQEGVEDIAAWIKAR